MPAHVWVRRIEDASGAKGTWDTVLMSKYGGAWIEFKWTETVNRKPKLREGQYAMGISLAAKDVPGAYVVGSTDGAVRVIWQTWDGASDWKLYVENQWDTMNAGVVLEVCEYLGLNPCQMTE